MNRSLPIKILCSATAITSITVISSALSAAHAASLSFSLNPFTGSNAKVDITLDDKAAGDGKVQFKVNVDRSVSLADIRGIFFNVADNVSLSGLKYVGSDITAFSAAGNVTSVGGNSNNLNGGGNSRSFDVGLEIGSEGLKGGKDDFQSTVFTLSHSSMALNLSHFANQSFGVRLMSVGTANNREGSSKLDGSSPVLPPVAVPTPTPTPPPVQPPVTVPPPVVIAPPPTPGPVPTTPSQPNKPTEIPEPSSVLALGFVAAGGLRLLKRRQEVQEEVAG